MIDNDRLIKAWEIFRNSNPYEICDGREFRAMREPEYCMGQMIEDTITLLKEQENDIHHMGLIIDEYEKELKKQPEIVRCKDCKHAVLTTSGEVKYCKCWQSDEDGTYGGDPLYLDGNFYCADGKKR